MTSLRGSGQRSYIRNVWNVLDFIILITTLFYLKEETDYLSFYYSGKNKLTDLSELEMKTSISNLRVFRVLRVLRPLRMINRFVGLKLVMNTVISSIFPMLNVLLILFLEILLFSIIGQSLYSNTFSHCVINGDIYLAREDDRIITSQDCIDLGYKWQNAPFNFDNIISGIQTLFTIYLSTSSVWLETMYNGIDAVGYNLQPKKNYNPWMCIFFIFQMIIANLMISNLMVAVIYDKYAKFLDRETNYNNASIQ